MLLVAERHREPKDAPNENYGREMMELFTLGADRGAYTERDVREQARALTGWQNDWKREPRRLQLPLRPDSTTTPASRPSSTSRGASTGRTRASSASRIPRTRRSSCSSSGATSSPTPPDSATQTGARGALPRTAIRCGRSLQAILQHPALYDGPRMVKPPVVHIAGLLRRLGAGDHDHRLGVDRPALGPAALLPAERRRLGRHPLARHRDLPRPLDRACSGSSRTSDSIPAHPPAGEPGDAPGVLAEGAQVLEATRRFPTATHARAAPVRAARARRRGQGRSGSASSTRCSSRTRSAS